MLTRSALYKDPYKLIILNEQVLYARYSATSPSFLCLHTTELVILKTRLKTKTPKDDILMYWPKISE